MSEIVNNIGARPGSIYRIALENFLTYTEVELFPNTSLNLIIGPNGTGKSTFVCAIILGLCGKPQLTGRSKKLADYVRTGCDQAKVELELYKNQGERNVIITRIFNSQGESSWAIDHKSAREKTVQDLVTSLKIQVDNLCQMLPQNRVQDFCQMNPQQLLQKTLSTVDDHEALGQMTNLVNYRTEQREMVHKAATNEKLIEEQMVLYETLKKQIEAMQHRTQYEKKIEICDKKKPWLEYKILKETAAQCEVKMKEALNVVRISHMRKEPMEKVVQDLKNKKSKLEQERANGNRKINDLADKAKELLNKIQNYDSKIREVDRVFEEKLERHRNRERELVEARTKLDKLKNDKTGLVEKFGNDDSMNRELTRLRDKINGVKLEISRIQRNKTEKEIDYEQRTLPNVRALENRLRRLQDVETKRLETLRRYSEDTFKALEWLNENRDMFQSAVYGPMMLELKFTDPEMARYLESTVSSKDLIAFTFESSRDMNLFLQKVRIEQQLKVVNAISSQGGNFVVPRMNIKSLRYLGFQKTLVDGIIAPDPILRYLCEQYNIHRIPIGNDHTYHHSENVPENIGLFFTTNHRFSVKVSLYSKVKSSMIVEVKHVDLLANMLDVEQIENCTQQLQVLKATSNKQMAEIQKLGENISELENTLRGFNNEQKTIRDNMSRIEEITAQIRIQQKKVQTIENEDNFNMEVQKRKCCQQQSDLAKGQCTLQAELCDAVDKLHNASLRPMMLKVHLEIIRNEIVRQESELTDLRNELNEARKNLELYQQQHTDAKSKAKSKLLEAKQLCNNKDLSEKDFPFTKQFQDLPDDLPSLREHRHELQTRINCMGENTGNVIQEFENCKKAIETLQTETSNINERAQVLARKMEDISTNWLPSVERLLQEIGRRFSEMFALLNCSGEVKLDKGNSDEDFDKYGIVILVRFRESEGLQPLCRKRHSGGERALSIALYLMALQRLFTVPFRCVDEINQGMDEINERKMFQLLVQVTSECENSQYFLLTPKLLSNLEYNDKIMVHTIMNGKYLMKYKEWNHNEFLQRTRLLRKC